MTPKMLFVYGTLRQGFGNHRLIEHCPKVGDGTIKAVLHVSGLPYISHGEGKVVGEVYEIDLADDWNQLDGLEGHPNWYRREVVTVDLAAEGESKSVEAWAYYMPKLDGSKDNIVENGDYKGASRW